METIAENPLENLVRHLERIAKFNGINFKYNLEPYPREWDFQYYLSIESQGEAGPWEPFIFEMDRSIDGVVERVSEELPKSIQDVGLTWVD